MAFSRIEKQEMTMKHAVLLIAILSVMAQAVVLSDFEGQGNGAMPQGWLIFIAG